MSSETTWTWTPSTGPGEIAGVLDDINADVSGQYTLGYYAADKAPGWRSIRVQLVPGTRAGSASATRSAT